MKKVFLCSLPTFLVIACLTTACRSDISPSPQPSPTKGEGEKVAEASPIKGEEEKAAEEGIASEVPSLRSGPPRNDTEGDAINIPDVVATVNENKITKQQLEERMAQSKAMDPERFDTMSLEQKKQAIIRTIDNMIIREVLYQEAVRRNIVVTDEEVDLNLESLKRQFPSEEAFQKTFAEAKITIPVWKVETKKNLRAMKLEDLVVDEIPIPDNELTDYYEKNKKDLNKDAIKISHILVDTEEEAKKVIKKLKKKEDFGSLAKKYSLDTFTKDKGGDLGWYGRGELLKVVEDTAYSLSPGQISDPVKSQFGYHIIRLDEKKVASEQTMEDHREHVRSILQQAKWQKLRLEWLKVLLNNARVWKWSP